MRFAETSKWVASGVEADEEDERNAVTGGELNFVATVDSEPDCVHPIGCAISPFPVVGGSLYRLRLHATPWCTVGAASVQLTVVVASLDESWQELVPVSLDLLSDALEHEFVIPTYVTEVVVHCCFSAWSLFKARSAGFKLNLQQSTLKLLRPHIILSSSSSSTGSSAAPPSSHQAVDEQVTAALTNVIQMVYVIGDSRSPRQSAHVAGTLRRLLKLPTQVQALEWPQTPVTSGTSGTSGTPGEPLSSCCSRCFTPNDALELSTGVAITPVLQNRASLEKVLSDAHASGYTNILIWSDLWYPRSDFRLTLEACVPILATSFGALIVDGEKAEGASSASSAAPLPRAQSPFARSALTGVILSSSLPAWSFQTWLQRLQRLSSTTRFDKVWVSKNIENVHCVRTHSEADVGAAPEAATPPTSSTIVLEGVHPEPSSPDVTLLSFIHTSIAAGAVPPKRLAARVIRQALEQSQPQWQLLLVVSVDDVAAFEGCTQAVEDTSRKYRSRSLRNARSLDRIHVVTVPATISGESAASAESAESNERRRAVLQALQPHLAVASAVAWWSADRWHHRDRLAAQLGALHAQTCDTVRAGSASLKRTDTHRSAELSPSTTMWTTSAFRRCWTAFTRATSAAEASTSAATLESLCAQWHAFQTPAATAAALLASTQVGLPWILEYADWGGE
jgi:hypothetical protein